MTDNLTSQAKHIYNIANWSDGYFDIDNSGHLVVQPKGKPQTQVQFTQIVQSLKEAGLRLPVLLRFTDILRDRVQSLNEAFNQAIEQYQYQGRYTPVYPIKVNQQHSVVEQLLKARPQIGLEAGSKPELLAILGVTDSPLNIVCNGYKDREFLQLAIAGQQMGHTVYVVVEKLSELESLLKESSQMQAAPSIGIRIRLNSVGKGRWQNSGGEKGKFGLTSHQLLQAISLLKAHNKLELFRLVHFHIGSQIANIRDIQIAIKECARYYAELKMMGVPINTIDVGGGLGVDYEGSGSRSQCSMNYDMSEYARNIVGGISEVCAEQNLPQPNIITESGRAMTAHHAVLITNVIDVEKPIQNTPPFDISEDAPIETLEMAKIYENLSTRRALECYHDALHYFSEAQQKFTMGLISLSHWAELESTYFSTLHLIRSELDANARAHRSIKEELDEKLAHKLFCNFSLFQSLPDAWGIQQIFPVMPLSQLNQKLTQRAIIQDITCDSDGQIKQYADGMGLEASLPIPEYQADQGFYLGMFMVGAYQEILGDMHNLFGDTDSAHLEFDAQGQIKINHILQGDTAESVLKTVHFQKQTLLDNYQTQLSKSDLSTRQKDRLYSQLKIGIEGYTYFEDE
ncbi:biosynthetic arginine decarboxylase [Catenovulum sediminis]|uniref:biosynthetic arginine decarboxylase n=1 Tax=Catenovulum sediminis TaxID=1740262 RepID=UPI00117FF268|nr:biosynthetic arginine decarboxylase [Catenovulum sediminis]